MKISYLLFSSMILLSSSLSSSNYQNLPMGESKLYSFSAGTHYYYKVHSDAPFKQTITIETNVEKSSTSDKIRYTIDIKDFPNEPSDYEVTNVDYSWSRDLFYQTYSSYYNYDGRKYTYKPNKEFEYLAICIYSEDNINKMIIDISSHLELPTWLIVIIIIVSIIILIAIIIGIRACLRTEEGKEICRCLCVCCVAFACLATETAVNSARK